MSTKIGALEKNATECGFIYEQVSLADLLSRGGGPGEYNKVEDIAARAYSSQECQADRCEGAVFFLVGKILLAHTDPHSASTEAKLIGINFDENGEHVFYRSPSDHPIFATFAGFSSEFSKITIEQVKLVFDFYCSTPNRAGWPRHAGTLIKWTFVQSLLERHMDGLVKEIAWTRLQGHLGMGWPDLTLIEKTGVSFVEVKLRNDELTPLQIIWSKKIMKPLRLRATLLHVI